MKKAGFITAVLLFLFVAVSSHAAPPVRYATCDACGYCPIVDNINGTCTPDPRTAAEGGNPVPGNWDECASCLYPGIYPTGTVPDPAGCETLIMPGSNLIPPTPYPGLQYTMIGCLSASGNVFEDTSATGASTFVQAIFDLLVFRVIGGIAFLYLMYGAFLVLTSQADPEKLNYGRRVIIGAVVGLLFALGSVFIVNLIGSGILRLPGFTGNK